MATTLTGTSAAMPLPTQIDDQRPARAVVGRPTTFRRVLSSEWTKQVTLRSTWITAGTTLAIIVGFGVLAALMSSGSVADPAAAGAGPGAQVMSPLDVVLAGANLALLVIAVMGAIVGAREFNTGMIRTTLSAVPKRLPVLWAKLLSFAGIMVPTVLLGTLVAFFAGMAVLDANGAATMALSDPGVARAVFGTALYTVGLGLIGLALGMILRSTGGAIGAVLGGVMFLPALAGLLLPDSWGEVLKYLPSNAGTAFTTVGASSESLLTPGAGALVFVAWIALAVGGAAWALLRRNP